MHRAVAGFDWDRANRAKCQKHGVSHAEIKSIFRGPLAVLPDQARCALEERFKAIGQTEAGRHVLLVFTFRRRGDEALVRPASARFMHRKEVDYYEKAIARSDD